MKHNLQPGADINTAGVNIQNEANRQVVAAFWRPRLGPSTVVLGDRSLGSFAMIYCFDWPVLLLSGTVMNPSEAAV